MRRTGRDGFLRNVCVALGNRAAPETAPALERALRDDPDWLVRAHAAWALGEVAAAGRGESAATDGGGEIARALREARSFDSSTAVREEAEAALVRAAG